MNAGANNALQVRGLCKNFGALAVAHSIDLDLAPGARMGLIGPNGAGKTTLINLLTGMLSPDAGSIRLNGETIDRIKPEDRVRRGLARIRPGLWRMPSSERPNGECTTLQATRTQMNSTASE